MSNRQSYFLAVCILLVAIFLRMTALLDLPMGLHSEEINTIRLTETVRQGAVSVFLQDSTGEGREAFYPTGLAVTTLFTGNGVISFRVISVWLNVILLAVVYTLGVRLFGRGAGLLAMALLGVMFWAVLLSRLVLAETLVPLLVAVTMLAIARAIPVYRVARRESATTLAFAGVGLTMSISLYAHPSGVSIVLASLLFIGYVLLTRRKLARQRLSFIGFALLIVAILSLPYLIFTINRPELSASNRVFGEYQGIINSILRGLGSLFAQGDSNPTYNLPLRPLFDPLTFFVVLVGLAVSAFSVRYARYALVMTFFVVLAPSVLLAPNVPNHLGLSAWLPILALGFGVGVTTIYSWLPTRETRAIVVVLAVGLLGINAYGTQQDLFIAWASRPDVAEQYNTDLYQLARHLDQTLDTVNTVICNPYWADAPTNNRLTNTQLLLLMMSRRDTSALRVVDCRFGFVFTNGGALQQVVFPEMDGRDTLHPQFKQWVERGNWLTEGLPPNRLVSMNVEQGLADALGLYTTTAQATYGAETPENTEGVYPPVRFGGNVTWLGYDVPLQTTYRAGETLELISYWRVEGVIPRDLTFFTHVLSDPLTIASNRDTIASNPRRLQARDVVAQVTQLPLQDNLLAGEYWLSVGAYQSETQARLPLFDAQQVRRSDRLFLYAITITP